MPVYVGPWIPTFKGIVGDTKFNDWKEQIQFIALTGVY